MCYRARLWSLRYGFAPFAIGLRVRSAGLSSKFQGWRHLTAAGQLAVSGVVPQVFLLCGLALLDMSEVERAKQEADRLHEAGDHEASYKMLLHHKECGDPDLLWRLARVTFKRCELAPKAEKEAGLAEGIAYLDKAVQCGGEDLGPVHKWYSILIGSKKDHPTTKERIHDGFLIKKHVQASQQYIFLSDTPFRAISCGKDYFSIFAFLYSEVLLLFLQRAIELMPQDPLNYYVLGNWCYEVAGTPWLIRKAGQLVFSEIPSSTYEEALKHFLKAEEIKPNFYTRNLLMIAKSLLELNRKDEAVTYLKRCVNLSANPTVDDKRVCEEAQQSLKKLGMS
ncbi:regulator of microtubule dynamics protein 1-like [Amblyomma americanum]